MGKVVLGAAMSLDGFINDASGSVQELYPDLGALRDTEPMRAAIQNTGAVVMGWNAFGMAEDPDSYAGSYEFQVPIFVVTRQAPKKMPKQTPNLTFHFVTDGIESAVRQAKAAARDKDIAVIGGARTAQRCIKAGLADELHIDLIPVLFGGGLRLFGDIGADQVQLERIKVIESPAGSIHLEFRFIR